jgi:hypothetical protein
MWLNFFMWLNFIVVVFKIRQFQVQIALYTHGLFVYPYFKFLISNRQ